MVGKEGEDSSNGKHFVVNLLVLVCRLYEADLLSHVAQHDLRVTLHRGHHVGLGLPAPALLGDGGEPAVHQHLAPPGVVPDHPGHDLPRDVGRGAGAQEELLVVVEDVIAGVELRHLAELVRVVGAGGGGADPPGGTLQALLPQPLHKPHHVVQAGVPHPLHLLHTGGSIGVAAVSVDTYTPGVIKTTTLLTVPTLELDIVLTLQILDDLHSLVILPPDSRPRVPAVNLNNICY